MLESYILDNVPKVNSTIVIQSGAAAQPLPDNAPRTGAPRPSDDVANVQEPVLQYVNDWDAKLFDQSASGSLADLLNDRMNNKHGTTGESYDN